MRKKRTTLHGSLHPQPSLVWCLSHSVTEHCCSLPGPMLHSFLLWIWVLRSLFLTSPSWLLSPSLVNQVVWDLGVPVSQSLRALRLASSLTGGLFWHKHVTVWGLCTQGLTWSSSLSPAIAYHSSFLVHKAREALHDLWRSRTPAQAQKSRQGGRDWRYALILVFSYLSFSISILCIC